MKKYYKFIIITVCLLVFIFIFGFINYQINQKIITTTQNNESIILKNAEINNQIAKIELEKQKAEAAALKAAQKSKTASYLGGYNMCYTFAADGGEVDIEMPNDNDHKPFAQSQVNQGCQDGINSFKNGVVCPPIQSKGEFPPIKYWCE